MIEINEQYTRPLESLHYKNNITSATESSKFNFNIKIDLHYRKRHKDCLPV